LSTSDRAGLIDNAFNLAKASLIEYTVPLKLSLYLERENRYTPWRSFDMSVGYIKKMLVAGSYYGQWQVRFLGPLCYQTFSVRSEFTHHLGGIVDKIK